MKRGGGRVKGSVFERKVARMICKAFRVPSTECYRTPLSGGHPFADRGDLVIGPKLLPRFPYIVECKHTKAFRIEHLFKPPKFMHSWAEQVTAACKGTRDARTPLIIFRGNYTLILVAAPVLVAQIISWDRENNCFTIRLANRTWQVIPLARFLTKQTK